MTGPHDPSPDTAPTTRRYHAPRDYAFSQADIERFSARFAAVPLDAVVNGTLARVWNDGSSRGCPSASSILPVLLINTWPTNGEDWTPWFALSHRTIAALAGVNKSSVRRGLDHLVGLGLAEVNLGLQHPRDGGLARSMYRLHRTLYPAKGTRFFRLLGSLIYGGVLAMLPRASARHLLLVIGALDPVADERKIRAIVGDDGCASDDPGRITRARHNCKATASYLAEVSGLSPSTVQEALAILCAPMWAKAARPALVSRGEGAYGVYYHPNHETLFWCFRPEAMNDAAERARIVQARWGHLLAPARERVARSRVGRTERDAA